MTEDHSRHENGTHAVLPRPRDLFAAIGLLTIIPFERPHPKSTAFAHATVFFPFVGLLIGATLARVNSGIAHRLPNWLASVVLIASWELLRGAEAIRTVSRVFKRDARAGVEALRVIAIAAIWLTKLVCLVLLGPSRLLALLFAPTLGSWGMVVLATGARDAEAPGQKFNAAITFREFAVTSVFTLSAIFTLSQAVGIAIVVCVAATIVALRVSLHRWAAGISWQWLQDGAQLVETCVVLVTAAL